MNGQKNHSEFSSNLEFRYKSSGRNNHNAAKLIEKYNNLAREALSSGDKILSENYLQHADHFSRILSMQELNKSQNNVIEQTFKKEIGEVKKDIDEENKLQSNVKLD